MKHVAVLGAGLAGLSASLRLADAGCRVTIFEARHSAGGRAFSFTDRISGEALDNGQHAMMGCYHATLRYVRRVGSEEQLQRLRGLSLEFRHTDGRTARLRAGSLPHPLGMVQGFLRYGMLSTRARLGLLRVAFSLRRLAPGAISALHGTNAEDWLRGLGQSRMAIEYFWEPVVLATLNAQPARVSAGYLATVLRAVFLADAASADMILPRVGLSELLIAPAVVALQTSGSELHTSRAVVSIRSDQGRIRSVLCSDGSEIPCDAVVSALPPWSLGEVLGTSGLCAPLASVLPRFRPSPIVSVHVWLRRDPQLGAMTGTFGTTIQWIFYKGRSTDGSWRISCTVSAADDLESLTSVELRALTVHDLLKLLPRLREDDVIRVLPLRERRATFFPETDLDAIRPGPRSETHGLYLAGDWTATTLPATIEGAVLSGETAAQALMQDSAQA